MHHLELLCKKMWCILWVIYTIIQMFFLDVGKNFFLIYFFIQDIVKLFKTNEFLQDMSNIKKLVYKKCMIWQGCLWRCAELWKFYACFINIVFLIIRLFVISFVQLNILSTTMQYEYCFFAVCRYHHGFNSILFTWPLIYCISGFSYQIVSYLGW